jgi:ribosomal protein S18 acetylase RimI-like enzyme
MENFIALTVDNLANEHLCCAIGDKKHAAGVDAKKAWLRERIAEGHTFRKLNAQGKVFIEYAPLETAWTPVVGDNYLYIYCLWVAGSFKEQGYGRQLLESCLADAKRQGKAGVCVLSSKKKLPYISDKKFFQKFGFAVADAAGDYELLALPLDAATPLPRIADSAKTMTTPHADGLTVYYTAQCPFILNCIREVQEFCTANHIALHLEAVDSLAKAKAAPVLFNNWAAFYKGKFLGTTLLNAGLAAKAVMK